MNEYTPPEKEYRKSLITKAVGMRNNLHQIINFLSKRVGFKGGNR